MKRGKKMLTIIFITTVAIGLITWGVFAFLGRSQTLSIKSIENASDDLYVVRLEKPDNMTWEPGSYVKITLPEVRIASKITDGLQLHLLLKKKRL